MFKTKGKTGTVLETVEIEKEAMFRPFSIQFNTRRDCEAAVVIINAAVHGGLEGFAGDVDALDRAYELIRRLGEAVGTHLPRDTQLTDESMSIIGG